MNIAQSLYEGIDMGKEGAEGLITYMRTDSVRIAPEAIEEARAIYPKNLWTRLSSRSAKDLFIARKAPKMPTKPSVPTNLLHPPEAIKQFLTPRAIHALPIDLAAFYASQMMPAVYDTVSADISCRQRRSCCAPQDRSSSFKAFWPSMKKKWMKTDKDDESRMLPPLEEEQPSDID